MDDEADDPRFERLGEVIAACGEIEGDLELIYRVVIALARQALSTAEDIKIGRDPRVDASERVRDKALDMARLAEDLAIFCRVSERSGKSDIASLLSPWAGLDPLAEQHGMM